MKRMHIHIGVKDIQASVAFYQSLFGVEPSKLAHDYAKWQLDEPYINFAISTKTGDVGVNHLGMQVDDDAELAQLETQLSAAQNAIFQEGEVACCYTQSKKSWARDPSGVNWELFRSMDTVQVYAASDEEESCCTPETKGTPGCCEPSEKTAGCCGP